MTSLHPEFAPISFLSALSLLLPLPWHWRARNVATLAMIAWLFCVNIIFAVDAVIWGDNIKKVVPIWCDITTKILVGANFALPAACLCICVHLERVASGRLSQATFSERNRRKWFELGMCLGLPFLFMILHYIVQGHRFDIIEGYGCRPATYFSIASILIVFLPPILISAVSMIYAGLALRHFISHRLTFAARLGSTSSSLTTSRYLRLMTMAALQMVWSISATSYSLQFTVQAIPIRPWTNWDDVHSNFLRIDVFLDSLTPAPIRHSFYILWWITPISTFLFVVFFSFGKDAMDEYMKCFKWIHSRVFREMFVKPSLKKTKGFNALSSETPAVRGLPISKPILSWCSNTRGPSSHYPPSLTSTVAVNAMDKTVSDLESQRHSHATQYVFPLPYHGAPKAIGSYADLSLNTPSTIVFSPLTTSDPAYKPLPELPEETSNHLNSPSANRPPLLRAPLDLPTQIPNARRLTYPSYKAAQSGINTLRPCFR